jgi:hypothetical protein
MIKIKETKSEKIHQKEKIKPPFVPTYQLTNTIATPSFFQLWKIAHFFLIQIEVLTAVLRPETPTIPTNRTLPTHWYGGVLAHHRLNAPIVDKID